MKPAYQVFAKVGERDLYDVEIAGAVPAGARRVCAEAGVPFVVLASRSRVLDTRENLARIYPGAVVRIFEMDVSADAPEDARAESDFDLDANGIFVGRGGES